jgi:hypothetical protein
MTFQPFKGPPESQRPAVIATVTMVLFAAIASTAIAQRGAAAPAAAGTPADATASIVSSAQAVLATLDAAGKATVQYPFDSAQKTRWSNLPSPMFERRGLRMGDLTAPQKAAVMNLLTVALSKEGYQKVVDIMRGDEVLRSTGGGRGGGAPNGGRDSNRGGAAGPPPGSGRGVGRGGAAGGPAFGEAEYYLAFVGTPSTTAPWTLQFGGHHLAINLTMAGSQATMAPSLPAAQPASYTFEGRTVRPLGRENDKAFALVNALDPTQRRQAILSYTVSDLVLGAGQDGRTIQPEGIRASALSNAQQSMLLEIVREWAGIMNDTFAGPRMSEIRSRLADTWFAWSGPTTNGSAAYFRIQGPTLVIEYAPQGGVDHIHTIYRDPTNDYGAGFARR